VWDTAENKGIVRLMSLREANRNQAFYSLMTLMSAQSPLDTDPSGMAAAHRRTEDRIKAAMEEGDAAGRVPPR